MALGVGIAVGLHLFVVLVVPGKAVAQPVIAHLIPQQGISRCKEPPVFPVIRLLFVPLQRFPLQIRTPAPGTFRTLIGDVVHFTVRVQFPVVVDLFCRNRTVGKGSELKARQYQTLNG